MQKSLKIGQKTFNWGERTYLMGILNVTPDSFSGDGLLAAPAASPEEQLDATLAQAQRFATGGADILDVGGESTRPGAEPVSVDDEIQRVVPVIRRLSAETDLPISVDTYKAVVAEEAIKAGARSHQRRVGLQGRCRAGGNSGALWRPCHPDAQPQLVGQR